jgi:hypothetical protein
MVGKDGSCDDSVNSVTMIGHVQRRMVVVLCDGTVGSDTSPWNLVLLYVGASSVVIEPLQRDMRTSLESACACYLEQGFSLAFFLLLRSEGIERGLVPLI